MKLSNKQMAALRAAMKDGEAVAPTRTVGFLAQMGWAVLNGAKVGKGRCGFTITDGGRAALAAAAAKA